MTRLLRSGELRTVLILSAFVAVAVFAFRYPQSTASSPLIVDETAATFAADCVTPKTDFVLGETVCGKVFAPFLGPPTQREFEFSNPANYVVQIGPDIITDPQTTTFTLPSTQTSVAGDSTVVDNRGIWRFASVDSGAEGRAVAFFTVHDPPADLSITKTDGQTAITPNTSLTYTIVVTNAGPGQALGAVVTDTFPAAITGVSWTCTPSGGAACGSPSGVGNINQLVNLPVGGSVTYTAQATVGSSASGNLSNTATVAAPAGVTDPNPANNSATDSDAVLPKSVFVIDDVSKPEGNSGTTQFVFTISRTGSTGFPASVQYQTFDGSATVANNDYQPASGVLSFGPTETSRTVTVLVNGDTTIEPNEVFALRLVGSPLNGVIGDPDGQGLIQNDDFAATPTPVPTPTPVQTPTPVPTPTPTPANRFEGDINRTVVGVGGTGDGDVNVADQIQYQRFLSNFNGDCPSLNEQPRLDAGPRSTLGDGSLGAADGTAIDAYARHDSATDFDPNTPGWQPTPVGGPATISNLGCTPQTVPEVAGNARAAANVEKAAAAAARVIRIVSRTGVRNSDVILDVDLNAQGNEAGTQFGFQFDSSVLSISSVSGVNANPDIMLGAGAPEGTSLNVNAGNAVNGYIGIVENFSAAAIRPLPAGLARVARLKFHVLDGAAGGISKIEFENSVVQGITSDVNGIVLSSNYEGGHVLISSSRTVSVSGRVTTSEGRGLRGATVTIIDGEGYARSVTTSSFGFYTFDDVDAATYTIGVASRQYRFSPRAVTVGDNIVDVNFTGLE